MGSIAGSRARATSVASGAALVVLSITRVSLAVEPPNPKDLTVGNWELQLDKS